MAEEKVSMKIVPKAHDSEPATLDGDALYPYGLRITLNSEALKALGLDRLPAVGSVMCIEADVKVIGARSNEETDGVENSVELQITDMVFCNPAEEDKKKDAAGVLYGA